MSFIQEIIDKEHANTHHIYFYREGVFYKAYEHSAYLFITNIKAFQTKKRFVKSISQEIVSIGFPTNSLKSYFSVDKIKEEGNMAEVELDKVIDITAFTQWKSELPIYQEEPGKQMKPVRQHTQPQEVMSSNEELIMKIRMFPIEGKTPLECMLFLSEIKSKL